MRHSLKWFLMSFLVFTITVMIPFATVNAEDTEKNLYPRIDQGDESNNVKPGSGKPGSSTEFNHPDYGSDLDSVLGSDKNQEKDTDHELGNTPDDEPDISDTPDTSVEESDDEKEEIGDEPKEPGNNNEKDKENADKEEKENTDKEDDDGGSLKDLWNNARDTANLTFGIVNSIEGTGTAEGNLKLSRNIINIPITILKPNMSDEGKAASDLGLFGIEATEDTIKWVKRLRDPVSRAEFEGKYPKQANILATAKDAMSKMKIGSVKALNLGKDAVKSNSSFIYLSAKGKGFLGKTQNLFSNGGTALKNTISNGTSFLKSKGKNLLSKGSNLFSNTVSKGKGLVSKGKNFLSGPLSKGKDILSKGSNLVSSTISKGKDLVSKGKSLLSGPLSKGKDLLSKGSNLVSNTVSKGKDLVSKGKNLLSGPLSKGKDLLKKGNNIVSNTITKGKELGKTVLKSKAFGAVKNFATKGTGVLSAVGVVSDTIDAVSNFKAGNYLDSTGNALGAIGGAVVAVSMFTPVGPVVGTAALVATGASLVIEHRDAIKKGAKKAKDTVVNAAKSAGNKIKNGFKSLGKGIGGLLGG